MKKITILASLIAMFIYNTTQVLAEDGRDKQLIAELKKELRNIKKGSELYNQVSQLIKDSESLQNEQKKIMEALPAQNQKLAKLQEDKENREKAAKDLKKSDDVVAASARFCKSYPNSCDQTEINKLHDDVRKACADNSRSGYLNQACVTAQNTRRKALKDLGTRVSKEHDDEIDAVNEIIKSGQMKVVDLRNRIMSIQDQRINLQEQQAESNSGKTVNDILDHIVGKGESVVLDEKLLLLDAKSLKNELGVDAANADKLISDLAERMEEKLDNSALGTYIHNQIGQALSSSAACDAILMCTENSTPSSAQHSDLSREGKAVTKALENKKSQGAQAGQQ